MKVRLDPSQIPSIAGARLAILQTKWYREYTDAMVQTCLDLLESTGCHTPERHLLPGALELPLAAQFLLRNGRRDQQYDVLICFGAVMKGETYHFEMIMNECIRGLGHIMRSEGVPIIVEVIPVRNVEQLAARSGPDQFNKGIEAALAAAEIIDWRRSVAAGTVSE